MPRVIAVAIEPHTHLCLLFLLCLRRRAVSAHSQNEYKEIRLLFATLRNFMHTQSYKNVFVRVTYVNKLWYLGVTPFGTPKPTAEYHVGIMVAFSECVCVSAGRGRDALATILI